MFLSANEEEQGDVANSTLCSGGPRERRPDREVTATSAASAVLELLT